MAESCPIIVGGLPGVLRSFENVQPRLPGQGRPVHSVASACGVSHRTDSATFVVTAHPCHDPEALRTRGPEIEWAETSTRFGCRSIEAPWTHMLHSAWVGDIRAARRAGISPATAPMIREAAKPPSQASGGTTVDQPLVWAYTDVDATPSATPTTPPRRPRRTASERNWARMWPLVAPRARRRPISERRSRTEMIMMLATPTAPTRRATAPRPRKRPLRALLASA